MADKCCTERPPSVKYDRLGLRNEISEIYKMHRTTNNTFHWRSQICDLSFRRWTSLLFSLKFAYQIKPEECPPLAEVPDLSFCTHWCLTVTHCIYFQPLSNFLKPSVNKFWAHILLNSLVTGAPISTWSMCFKQFFFIPNWLFKNMYADCVMLLGGGSSSTSGRPLTSCQRSTPGDGRAPKSVPQQ